MNNLDNIGQTFQWAGQRYMAIMQPFAEKIFLGLGAHRDHHNVRALPH